MTFVKIFGAAGLTALIVSSLAAPVFVSPVQAAGFYKVCDGEPWYAVPEEDKPGKSCIRCDDGTWYKLMIYQDQKGFKLKLDDKFVATTTREAIKTLCKTDAS